MKKVIVLVLFLAACKGEPRPYIWGDHLDSYMSARGYTVADDGETILKNGFPVWKDPECWGRGCMGSHPLVTRELAEAVRLDLLDAIEASQAEYVEDVSEKIGIEPKIEEKTE